MYTHWQSQHACNHMPNARVGNCLFIRWPAHCRLLPSCLLASRACVCAHCSSKSSTCACACSSLFGEAVSMSERSERILTMSEALVLCGPLLFVVCECRRHEPRSCEAARTTKKRTHVFFEHAFASLTSSKNTHYY